MIEVVGIEGSSEFAAAISVRDALIGLWPDIETSPTETESIVIAANANISGYGISNFDVVVAARFAPGRLFRPTRVVRDQNNNRVVAPVKAVNLVAAIEVKDHDPLETRITGEDISVRYSKNGAPEWSSATEQNIKQTHALKSYFADQHAPLYVSRAVIMRGFEKAPCSGALGRTFTGGALLTAIAENSSVYQGAKECVLRAGAESSIGRALQSPVFRVIVPSNLDRKRMDRIATRSAEIDRYQKMLGSKMIRFRGRGGTGKTVMLLQLAWQAFDQLASRSIVLTYNHALASDIRRLMALMNVPSDPSEGGISVRTVMSFTTSWLSRLGLLRSSDEPTQYDYENQCRAALELIQGGALTQADVAAIKLEEPGRFSFDHVIADESQDWPASELELIKALYGPERLCVADGVDQLIRGVAADWDRGVPESHRVVVPLSRCLRMKANLAVFLNALAERANMKWKVEPNNEAGGGRVIVVLGSFNDHEELHRRLQAEAISAGNSGVDSLFCIPPDGVKIENGIRASYLADTLNSWGHDVWDGVDEVQRRDFPRSPETLRVVQYASCRGLEGWVAVLDGLDRFWGLMNQEVPLSDGRSATGTGLPPSETARAAAWRWCFIPLTRAIDTLVICIDNVEGEFGKSVLSVARQYPDIVSVVGTGAESRLPTISN